MDLEAAVTLTSAEVDESERALLEEHGWSVRTLHEVPFGHLTKPFDISGEQTGITSSYRSRREPR